MMHTNHVTDCLQIAKKALEEILTLRTACISSICYESNRNIIFSRFLFRLHEIITDAQKEIEEKRHRAKEGYAK